MTQIGIMIEGQDGLNWQRWENILRTSEQAGYQCVFRSDHFTNANGIHKDALELWASLTYAATITEKIEFGCLVTPITFRHPAMTVQQALAVDLLSKGRLVLGMGTGWQDREHREFGIPFPDLSERYEHLTEGLEITRLLLNSTEPVSFQGKHYQLDGALLTMKNVGSPKILIGGNGRNKTLRLAAKYAVEWNTVYTDPKTFKDLNSLLNGYLAEEGRKPEAVKRSLMMRVLYGDEARISRLTENFKASREDLLQRGFIIGKGQAIVDQIGVWAEAGIERFMLQWLELDEMDELAAMAQDILPHFA